MSQLPSISGADYQVGDAIKGRWQIRQIYGGKGRSGMGVVYIVDDLLVRTTLAAKTFQPHLISESRVRRALEHEANAWLAMGAHPNIVMLEYVENMGTQIYLFMDYVAPDEQGRNCLTHYLNETPLPEALTARWAIQMCRALSHMRACGIGVHRDIKPDNVMIDRAQAVRVTDFGLAKAYTGMPAAASGDQIPGATAMGAVVGTPGYIAPEVVQGEPATVRSDIYAFGLVLVQMLTGKPWAPFTGAWQGDLGSYEAGNLLIRERLTSPLAGTHFADVAARCLAYDPYQRYSSFEEVEHELQQLCRSQAIDVPVAQVAAEAASSRRRSDLDQINALYSLGRLGEALDAVIALRRTNPDDPGLLTSEGVIRSDLGDTHNAIPLLERACELSPGWCGYWNNLGKALRAAGQSAVALEKFEKALQLDDRVSHMWASKGNCLKDLQRMDEALIAYDHAISLDALDWAAQLGRAQVLTALHRPVDAVAALERVFDVEPDDPEARALYMRLIAEIEASQPTTLVEAIRESNALYEQGDYADGLRVVQNARLQLGPSPDLWNNEGVFLTELADYRAAIRCFERGLRTNKNRSDLWTNKGRAYRRMQKPHEALQCHDNAIAINPDDTILWTNKHACLLDLDLQDLARDCLRSACASATSAEDRAVCREKDFELYYLSMAELAASDSRWAEAHRCANSIKPGSAWWGEAKQILGRAQFHLATQHFTKDSEASGFDMREVIETLGRAAQNLDDPEEQAAIEQQINIVCTEYLNRTYGALVEHKAHDQACELLMLVIDNSTDEELRAFAKKQISVWLANAAINMANESTSQRQMFIDRCAGVAG